MYNLQSGEEEKSEPASPDEKTGSFWKRFRSTSSGKFTPTTTTATSPRQ